MVVSSWLQFTVIKTVNQWTTITVVVLITCMATWIEPTCCAITLKTLEELWHGGGVQSIAAVVHDALLPQSFGQIFRGFGFSSPGPKKSIKKITKRVLRNWGCINTGNKKRHNTLWIQRRGFKQNKFASLTAMVRNSCRQKQNNLDWIVVGIQK